MMMLRVKSNNRQLFATLVLLLLVSLVSARKIPSSSRASPSRSSPPRKSANDSRRGGERVMYEEEEEEEEEDMVLLSPLSEEDEEEDEYYDDHSFAEEEDEVDEYEEEEEEPVRRRPSRPQQPRPQQRRPSSFAQRPPTTSSRRRGARPPKATAPQRRKPSRRSTAIPPKRGGPRHRPTGRGRVVPYQRPPSFLSSVSRVLPDPTAVRQAAVAKLQSAQQLTSGMTTLLYREVKGWTSSELEQVLLKATRPDDAPVKNKHVERLVGVTYQITKDYDIYDSVLRKIWNKLRERNSKTCLKGLYILHRFAADGSPRHAANLKARLRELRRTPDPKSRGRTKYFASSAFLPSQSTPFLKVYAHYVLLRAQCFGGPFADISKNRKNRGLRSENYQAAVLLLKAGTAACLAAAETGEEELMCENTALAAERVVVDLLSLHGAVASALSTTSSSTQQKEWCVWYREALVPQLKQVLQQLSPQLDAYGLYLPSRIPKVLSKSLLDKKMEELKGDEEGDNGTVADRTTTTAKATTAKSPTLSSSTSTDVLEKGGKPAVVAKEEETVEVEEEEYEYDEEDDEEYYDDEEEL